MASRNSDAKPAGPTAPQPPLSPAPPISRVGTHMQYQTPLRPVPPATPTIIRTSPSPRPLPLWQGNSELDREREWPTGSPALGPVEEHRHAYPNLQARNAGDLDEDTVPIFPNDDARRQFFDSFEDLFLYSKRTGIGRGGVMEDGSVVAFQNMERVTIGGSPLGSSGTRKIFKLTTSGIEVFEVDRGAGNSNPFGFGGQGSNFWANDSNPNPAPDQVDDVYWRNRRIEEERRRKRREDMARNGAEKADGGRERGGSK